MLFSKETGGFYDRTIHGEDIPADAVEITAEHHAALMQAQSEGKVITADDNGYPVAVERPPPGMAQMMGALRAERDRRLVAATAILDRHRNQRDFALETTITDTQARAWASYAQALRNLPETTIDPANPVWPAEPSTV